MPWVFVVHISPYPAKALVVCLMHDIMHTAIKLSHSDCHKAEHAKDDKRMAQKRLYMLVDGFVVMIVLHIFVLMFYKYYNNKTLAFCQFDVLLYNMPECVPQGITS